MAPEIGEAGGLDSRTDVHSPLSLKERNYTRRRLHPDICHFTAVMKSTVTNQPKSRCWLQIGDNAMAVPATLVSRTVEASTDAVVAKFESVNKTYGNVRALQDFS